MKKTLTALQAWAPGRSVPPTAQLWRQCPDRDWADALLLWPALAFGPVGLPGMEQVWDYARGLMMSSALKEVTVEIDLIKTALRGAAAQAGNPLEEPLDEQMELTLSWRQNLAQQVLDRSEAAGRAMQAMRAYPWGAGWIESRIDTWARESCSKLSSVNALESFLKTFQERDDFNWKDADRLARAESWIERDAISEAMAEGAARVSRAL